MIVDLLVDGESIQSYAQVVEDFAGLHAQAPLRGGNYTIPGRAGELWAPKVRGAYGFSLGLAILPVDPDTGAQDTTPDDVVAQWISNWRALMDLLDSESGPLTLQREVLTTTGTVYETCSAEVVGQIAPVMIGAAHARAVIDFWNLDGGWTAVPAS